jgi:TonB family protein
MELFASQDNPSAADVPVGVLEIPVGVWGSRRVESTVKHTSRLQVFSEETCTLIVFPHGAVIRLSLAIEPGQLVMITNRESGKQIFSRVVNVRKCPNVRGYAEIEFIQPINNFWGDYIPQGTMKLAERAKLPSTNTEVFPMPVPAGSKPAPIMVSHETSYFPAPRPVAATPTTLENFYSYASTPEKISAVATSVITSRDLPNQIRTTPEPITPARIQEAPRRANSVDKRSALTAIRELVHSWQYWGIRTQGAAGKNYSPRPALVLAGAAMLGILAIYGSWFLVHQPRSGADDVSNQASPIAYTLNQQDPGPESNSTASVPLPPIAANTESFPGPRTRKFAENESGLHPPARKSASELNFPSKKLPAPHWTGRSAANAGQATPPDVSGIAPKTEMGPIGDFIVGSRPVVGQVKEARLISKTLPNYPAAARLSGVEGKVTVEALVDTTGKLIDMKVISGPPVLHRAALDSLRTWKYQPAYLDGKPVQTKTIITVDFRLH